MGDCFILVAVGCLVHRPDANRNCGMVFLISKGLGENLRDAADATPKLCEGEGPKSGPKNN